MPGAFYCGHIKKREADIFVINSFEAQDFELDGDSLALSFTISPQFINNVAPELLTHRINCRSFFYAEDKQPAFHALRQDLARTFQMFYKKEGSGTAYAGSGAAVILEDLSRYFLDGGPSLDGGGVPRVGAGMRAGGGRGGAVKPASGPLEAPAERGLRQKPHRRRDTGPAAPAPGEGGL